MKQPLIVSINTPKALMGSLGNLSPKVFDSFFLDDPIHIASVLVQLIFRPEICNKYFNRLRNSEAEYSSANTAVVLFAYCSSLVSLLPTEIPLTFEFCLIETAIPLQRELTDMGRAGHPVLDLSQDENYQTKDHCWLHSFRYCYKHFNPMNKISTKVESL